MKPPYPMYIISSEDGEKVLCVDEQWKTSGTGQNEPISFGADEKEMALKYIQLHGGVLTTLNEWKETDNQNSNR